MNKSNETILYNYHAACNLSLYVLNENNEMVARYTPPLAPNLKENLIKKAPLSSELDIYLITNKSSLGIFKLDNYKIIGWNPDFTTSGKGGYLRKAPMLDYKEFSNQMSCLYYMFFQKWPHINSIQEKILVGESIDDEPTNNNSTYEGYLSEKELMDAVTQGNLARFNKFFSIFIKEGNFGTFSKDKNRDAKDMAIAATTLYTRAAIAGGLPASQAYGLSDHIIKQIEKDSTILNYYEYSRAIGEIFINRIIRHKRMNLTSTVYQAQEYIYANFRSITSVNEIAQSIGVSTSYLQHLFKKETGHSLINLINREKIKQAQHYLIFTKKSIEEIAYDSGYNNQSQFSTIFKKEVGITPTSFRKQKK
ncbi:helix-turn-helix domain-containing protein [Companilactobacillus sp. HBUAS56275]|jgi:AraC-type DNA-binding domain-containing proteins|uniref:AraC family transcriptional regulator n=1 Tax=Candidatus Companilactobacillus pullicola TaxID=2838523 RepID=A0A9D2CNI1_9LACO|nr:AraC family transcriptional regulator [Candidatus Companilactobacillus pullicola]